MNKFKKNDKVVVLLGKDRGKECTILKVFPKQKSLLLDNANFFHKHVKPTQENKGGIKQINKPIKWSKVSHVIDGSPESIKIQFENNEKVRYLKKSNLKLK